MSERVIPYLWLGIELDVKPPSDDGWLVPISLGASLSRSLSMAIFETFESSKRMNGKLCLIDQSIL